MPGTREWIAIASHRIAVIAALIGFRRFGRAGRAAWAGPRTGDCRIAFKAWGRRGQFVASNPIYGCGFAALALAHGWRYDSRNDLLAGSCPPGVGAERLAEWRNWQTQGT